MRFIIASLVLISLSGFLRPTVASPASTNDKVIQLALYDFKGRGIDSNTAIIFSDRFRVALIGREKIKVLERSEMNLVLAEQGFQKSGACDYDACLLEIGQLLGIQFLVAAPLEKLKTFTHLIYE